MKPYILLPFVLLAGLVLGGLGPRSELARVKDELEETRKLVRGQGGGAATMSNVSNLLGIERRSASSAPAEGDPENADEDNHDADAPGDDVPSGIEAAGDGALDDDGESEASVEDETSDDEDKEFGDDLDRAIELWQARVAIARNTFVSNAHLNDTQAVKFDTLLAAMNVRIGTTIDEFAKDVNETKDVQPEEGIRLVNDITESMVLTYDEMDDTMPKGWRGRAGDKFSMTDFVDPEVARPLVGLEGRLDHMIR